MLGFFFLEFLQYFQKNIFGNYLKIFKKNKKIFKKIWKLFEDFQKNKKIFKKYVLEII